MPSVPRHRATAGDNTRAKESGRLRGGRNA